jgi:hypothetical protein
MSRRQDRHEEDGRGSKNWLQRASDVGGKAPKSAAYRHGKENGAGAKRVRELAGVLKLNKRAPSRKFTKR